MVKNFQVPLECTYSDTSEASPSHEMGTVKNSESCRPRVVQSRVTAHLSFHKHTMAWLTLIPRASPEITATVTPSLLGLGISSLFSSWYRGFTIFCELLKLTHSCRPWTGSSEQGISACTMPWPAVIHCKYQSDKKEV